MARPRKEKSNIAVSPVNGQPTPRNGGFTSETAREARRIRTEKERAQKSITTAFQKYMGEVVATEKDGTELTGAQAIAKSIIRGATKGNAEMVKIALAITGETPALKTEASLNIVDEATRAHVQEVLDEITRKRSGAGSGADAAV